MRMILTILFFIPFLANATKYYVSNAGSDGNAGTSTGASWATVSKVNATATSGDSVFFNKGDSWNEQIVPAANNIYYGSYGTGNKPLITGFQTVSMSSAGGTLYTGTATNAVNNLNVVSINGTIFYKGRTPNTGYLVATAFLSTTQLKVPHSATDYTGKQIAVRSANWVIDTSTVSQDKQGASFDTLVLGTALTYGTGANGGNGYFFQNNSSYVDTLNEWSIIPATKVITVNAASSPTVQYASIDTLFNGHKKSNITIDGLNFTGANKMAISIDSSRADTIKNCAFLNNQDGLYWNYTRYNAVISDSINYSLNNGYESYNDTSNYVHGNYINHTGIYAGMGASGPFSYTGMFEYQASGFVFNKHLAYIDNNQVLNSGYIGVRLTGRFDTIYHNYVDTFCFVKQDGGGIYLVGANSQNSDTGTAIISNIVTHGIGAVAGSTGVAYVAGIYLDDYSLSVSVLSNTAARTNGIANITSQETNIKEKYNTLFDTSSVNNYVTVAGNNSGYVFIGNICFNSAASNFAFNGAKDSTETLDSNYYIYPLNPNQALNSGGTLYSLLGWQTYYPTYDIHSSATLPYGVTSNTPTLFINPTLVDSTIAISQGYYDAAGNGYATPSFVLPAFQSRILWPAIYNPPTFGYRVNIKTQ